MFCVKISAVRKMLEFVIIAMIVLWALLALRSIKKGKNQCTGDCMNCHKGADLCDQYYKDHPKKGESR